MATSTTSANVNGLASGIQWQDLIDQTIAAESARSVGQVKTRITTQQGRKTAWQSFQTLVNTFRDAAKALRDGGAFGSFTTSVGASATSGRTLLAATASAAAQPGSYKVRVESLARAEKLSGAVVSSASTALGIAGDVTINGRTITLQATDTLATVRDRINAANTGTTPTGVSASVLSSGSGQVRLVLTADTAGSAGITLGDGATGALRDLGLVDSTTRAFGSVGSSIAAMLGVVAPPAQTTVKVGNATISVDLSVDTLTTIQAKINAAGGQADIASDSTGGVTRYRLSIAGNVQPTSDAGSSDVVSMLGIAAGGRSAVKQVASTAALTGAAGAVATASTRLQDLGASGASAGIAAGDVVTLRGTRGDGSSAVVAIAVTGNETLGDLVARINNAGDSASFAGGARGATAEITADGALRLVDGTGGESKLGFSLAVLKPDGSTTTVAPVTTQTVGRQRQVVAGSDAQVRVDGVLLTRAGNTISDAIAGVTLNLQQAEAGTDVDLTVTRDTAASLKSLKDFASAYNAIADFADKQRVAGQPLSGDTILRGAVGSLTSALRTQVASAGSLDRLATAGVALSRTGQLVVDEAAVGKLLGTNLADLQSLLGSAGVGKAAYDAADQVTRAATGTVAQQLTSIDNAITSLNARADDMQRRLDVRRETLVQAYTRMEAAMSQFQSQGTFLSGQIKMMQSSN